MDLIVSIYQSWAQGKIFNPALSCPIEQGRVPRWIMPRFQFFSLLKTESLIVLYSFGILTRSYFSYFDWVRWRIDSPLTIIHSVLLEWSKQWARHLTHIDCSWMEHSSIWWKLVNSAEIWVSDIYPIANYKHFWGPIKMWNYPKYMYHWYFHTLRIISKLSCSIISLDRDQLTFTIEAISWWHLWLIEIFALPSSKIIQVVYARGNQIRTSAK